MSESTNSDLESPRRFHFNWLLPVLFRPRRTFERITALPGNNWFTPLLVLSVLVLFSVLAGGWAKQRAAMQGEMSLPPDFQYYSPEQQASYMQAVQAQQGPVFIYVLPCLGALVGLWLTWLVFGGLLHLILTLIGGRGDTGAAMNIVAWASLPLGVRALLRLVFIVATQRTITAPGLSGFAPSGEGMGVAFVASLLALTDLFMIWQLILILAGVRIAFRLPVLKTILGVLAAFLVVLALQALPGFLGKLLGGLSLTRPFFF